MVITIGISFEPRDLWVGVFSTAARCEHRRALTLYLTLVPMLPIRVQFILPKEAV